MSNLNSIAKPCEHGGNSKLYEFLATSYDISNLANKISATQNASGNILNLRKRVSNSDIVTA